MSFSANQQSASDFDMLPPELQQDILSRLAGDNVALFSAILVSKAWYNSCIGMLWLESKHSRLGEVSTLERQQHYANAIHNYTLDRCSRGKASDSLTFPMLREVLVYGNQPIVLRPYLQPTLRTLRIRGPLLERKALGLLEIGCPQLQCLEICGFDTTGHDPIRFATFLRSFPSLQCLTMGRIQSVFMHKVLECSDILAGRLTKLTLEHMYNRRVSDAFRRFLRNCVNLRILQLDDTISIDADTLLQFSDFPMLEDLRIEDILSEEVEERFGEQYLRKPSSSPRFQKLQHLSTTNISNLLIPIFSSVADQLIGLKLVVDDNEQSINTAVGGLLNLVHLDLSFDRERVFSTADFEVFPKLNRLESLRIRGTDEDWRYTSAAFSIDWFTDQHFEQLVSKLPRLRELRLPIDSNKLTFSAVESLGRNCPLLETCELLGKHDLSTWKTPKVSLFPNLESLHLGKARDNGGQEIWGFRHNEASEYARLLRSLAPRLKTFCVQYNRRPPGGKTGPTTRPLYVQLDEELDPDLKAARLRRMVVRYGPARQVT